MGLVFVLWGWSEGWGGDGVGNGDGKLFANPLAMWALNGVSPANYIYVLFQLTFAAITPARYFAAPDQTFCGLGTAALARHMLETVHNRDARLDRCRPRTRRGP